MERRLDGTKKVTVDPVAANIGDQIGTAVVLLRLYDGNFQFSSAREDGSDIRFIAADDKTPLKFHIEKYDSVLAEAYIWVKVPDLKPGAPVTFWMYSGNGGMVPRAAATQRLPTTPTLCLCITSARRAEGLPEMPSVGTMPRALACRSLAQQWVEACD